MLCENMKKTFLMVIFQVVLTWMPNVAAHASEAPAAPLAASSDNLPAANPKPDTGGFFVDGSKTMELAWKPGKHAVKQYVYFGNTAAEVLASRNPIAASLAGDVTSIPFPVTRPVVGMTYFWRVATVNSDKIPPTAGDVWSVRIIPRKLRIYLLGGQSNANGCTACDGLPDELLGPQKNVIIFARGGIKLKEYGWDWLRDGLGAKLNDTGKGTFGPELTFGMEMSKARPGEVMGIIKCAWDATNLGWSWRSPGAGDKVGSLYTKFIATMREGIAALDPAFEPAFAGMLWMQGESDSDNRKMADDYAKNLTAFIKDIRAETQQPDLPFVLGQISEARVWGPPRHGEIIRAAQQEVAGTVPHTAMFPTADLKRGDRWHYDTAGMVVLGKRFATAMLKLENK